MDEPTKQLILLKKFDLRASGGLALRLGLRVTIKDRGKKGGDFILHYDDLDQLDDILTKLSEPRLEW